MRGPHVIVWLGTPVFVSACEVSMLSGFGRVVWSIVVYCSRFLPKEQKKKGGVAGIWPAWDKSFEST